MAEFNRDTPEMGQTSQFDDTEEFFAVKETETYREALGQAEDNSASSAARKKKRKESDVSSLMKHLAPAFTVVAVVAIAAAIVSSGAFSGPSSQAEILSTSASDTTVSYEISVKKGEELEVILFNDFTHRREKLKEGENIGEFKRLKPGMRYTVAIVEPAFFGGDKTVREASVKTERDPLPLPVTEWRGVTYECRCSRDGYFYFTMDFVDENGYFGEFFATLTDSYGNVSKCEFSEDLHAEQRIDVALDGGLLGRTATFTLGYVSSDPNAATPDVIYTFDVKI